MELVGILIGLAGLAIPVAVIVLIADMGKLKRRVAALEARLAKRPRAAPEAKPARAADRASRKTSAALPDGEKPAGSGEAKPAAAWTKPPDLPPAPEPAAPPSGPPSGPPPRPPSAPRRPSGFDRGLAWVSQNWIYVISAISLGLAGIFLVQYGIETGLLTPWMRVLAAVALGAALVAAGELLRRRWGDEGAASTATLASTFSGAGIVVLYAAILAARGLYGLIGPETAFAGLVAVSALALVFGWFYGPFLAAAGIAGAAVAPFLVGGEAASGTLFYLFYGLLGAVSLAIDAARRWGWVSALGLGLCFLMGLLVFDGGGEFLGFALLLGWLALAAMALPRLEFWPSHPGATILESLNGTGRREAPRPVPPTWIAAGAMLAATGLLFLVAPGADAGEAYAGYLVLTLLILAVTLWAAAARGLADLALIPAAAFAVLLIGEAFAYGPLYREVALFDWAANPEARPPLTVTFLVGLATLATLSFAWRSFRGPFPALWAAAAAVFAPGVAVIFELFWQPGAQIGFYFWAGHAIALAALMVLCAERFAKADGDDRRRAAYAVLSALSLIALALFILLAEAALTVALAVLVAVAALLDRRFRLPEMEAFLVAGILTLGWRLVIDPGLDAYLEATPLGEAVLAFGAALIGLAAAWALLPPETRARARAEIEAALFGFGGAFAAVLLWRFVAWLAPAGEAFSHWSASLLGLLFAGLALTQLWRLRAEATLRLLRIAMAGAQGLLALVFLAIAVAPLNPFFGETEIFGPQPFDTLLIAYALPALAFAAASRLSWAPGRQVLPWLAGGFAALFVMLEIRRFWHDGQVDAWLGTVQPEVYTYTVALLVTGGALLYQAIARRSTGLRRFALAVVGLTVAKVFLIDAAGLSGLFRVFSFLGLGLALAGLAWFDRWAALRLGEDAAESRGP